MYIILHLATGLEPRICTRWDMHKFARDAYDLGIRYIGGCCGFEPYHIRAVAEEVRHFGTKSGALCTIFIYIFIYIHSYSYILLSSVN